MSFVNPTSRTRRVVSFYAQVLQAAAIVIGGVWALWSFENQLQAPYDEKQLSLYLEAARVAADLAKLPNGTHRDKSVRRFWQLYWGELAFVESRAGLKDENSIESRMVKLCNAVFGKDNCKAEPKSLAGCAINLSHAASDEIQSRWKPWRRKKPVEPESCPELPDQVASPPVSKQQ